jgi:hypothetical protein
LLEVVTANEAQREKPAVSRLNRRLTAAWAPQRSDYGEIVRSQDHGAVDPDLFFKELTGCLLFNYFAQPHELIYALMWRRATFTFEIVHRRGADRTLNYLVLIEHRKLNDHPIEVVALHLASPQWHCKFSMLIFIVPR